jgi:ribonuclease D
MKPLIVIDTPAPFQALVSELAGQQYLAIDTESNGYYAYHEHICLIQISTAAQDYIVDPLGVTDLSGLGTVLANPAIEKIMHAASNDIAGLKRDFHFQVDNLFDTALACKLLGGEQLGLSRIINEHFGVVLNKKWQRCDWGLRPLSPEQLEYARMDTHFLITLRHLLVKDLQARSLWEQARDSFAKACTQEIPERSFALQGYRRIHGYRNLSRISKLVLEALYLCRDRRARELDRAPFRVMSNEVLLRLANHRPTNLEELQKTSGLPRPYRNGRLAGELLAVVQQALRAAGPGTAGDPPSISHHDPIQGPGTAVEAYHTPSGEDP